MWLDNASEVDILFYECIFDYGFRRMERILFSVKNNLENKNGKSVDIFRFAAYNKIARN